MEETDPEWEWAAVIWGAERGMQGKGRGRSRDWFGLLVLLSGASSHLLPAPEGPVSQPGREWAAATPKAAEIESRPKHA